MEKTVEQLTGKISALETSLDEKQVAITGFETKERTVAENFINGDALVDCETRGLAGGLNEKKWLLVGGSTIAAAAV
ncbi:hypothetical protein, partial [Salmonella enterica]|uniref:hypothetical protein n=1 Tax=Salmonella enterica TaxID=28901 RepID=UPI0032991357